MAKRLIKTGCAALLALIATLGAGQALAAAPFVVDATHGTVTDTSTGLMWDQCVRGLSGSGCTGTVQKYSWANAVAQAATQSTANYKGYSDWRLPSIVELKTLVKPGPSPTIDIAAFPNTPVAEVFWSASSFVPTPADFAWLVFFSDGGTFVFDKLADGYVRLVRGGQYFGSFALLPGGVSGATATTATLTATSPVAATGYWLVVPRNATPPTPAQVAAGASYTGVTVAAAGNSAMAGKALKNFAVSGLVAGTAYDLYLVAQETVTGYASQLVGPLQFSTVAIATRSVVIDPAAPATLYAGIDGAGVYKSSNSGGLWTAAATQPGNRQVKALAIKPGDSTRLFAATYGGGVFKSSDSGVNWAACLNTNGGLTNQNLLSLAMDAPGKLYAGSEAGVFVSTDGCDNWTAMNNGMP